MSQISLPGAHVIMSYFWQQTSFVAHVVFVSTHTCTVQGYFSPAAVYCITTVLRPEGTSHNNPESQLSTFERTKMCTKQNVIRFL